MRVISGKLKGKRLFTPKGLELRPTSDRVKEAIFNILQNSIENRVVLDLFAGTGALGIEALSRGAKSAVFLEASSRSLAVLRKNIEACKLEAQAEVLALEVPRGIQALSRRGDSFHLVFLDPPYARGLARIALEALSEGEILAPGARIIAEHSPAEDLDSISHLEQVDRRKYGSTLVSFFINP